MPHRRRLNTALRIYRSVVFCAKPQDVSRPHAAGLLGPILVGAQCRSFLRLLAYLRTGCKRRGDCDPRPIHPVGNWNAAL